MEIILLTKDGCKNCTVFGGVLDGYGIDYEVQRIDSVDGQVIACACGLANYGSVSIPQLLIVRDGTLCEPYIVIKSWTDTIPTKEELEEIIYENREE